MKISEFNSRLFESSWHQLAGKIASTPASSGIEKNSPIWLLADTLRQLSQGLPQEALFQSSESSVPPIVTVIVTTYNCRHHIASCIASLLNQTQKGIEVILVDDCSTDGTYELALGFSRLFKKIRVFRTLSNAGTYVAKNLGLLHVRGKYVTFQDADDISHRERIEHQIQPLLNSSELVATSTQYCRIDENTGELLLNRGLPSRPGLISLMIDWAKLKDMAGFFDSVRVNADDEFKMRIRLVCGKHSIEELSACMYFALMRQDGLTATGHTANNIASTDMKAFLAPVRQRYTESFKKWHQSSDPRDLRIEFPGVARKFDAPISIDPFSRGRVRKNSLIVLNSSAQNLNAWIRQNQTMVSTFFTHVIAIIPSNTDETVFLRDVHPAKAEISNITVSAVSRSEKTDIFLKELFDLTDGGAVLLVDQPQSLDGLGSDWLRHALYKITTYCDPSAFVLSVNAKALLVPIERLDISKEKFRSRVNAIKTILVEVGIRQGLMPVFQ
jgi:glycosyltransferase involved in cell wall biosynthesis